MTSTPNFDWNMSSYENFLMWSADFSRLSGSDYLTPIRLLFVTLSAAMEALAQPLESPTAPVQEGLTENDAAVSHYLFSFNSILFF